MTRIGLTLGDPCGIGPELWLKTLLSLRTEPQTLELLTLYGDPAVLDRTAVQLGQQREWRSLRERLDVVPITNLSPAEITPGQPNSKSGAAQVSYLQMAIADAVRTFTGNMMQYDDITLLIVKRDEVADGSQ